MGSLPMQPAELRGRSRRTRLETPSAANRPVPRKMGSVAALSLSRPEYRPTGRGVPRPAWASCPCYLAETFLLAPPPLRSRNAPMLQELFRIPGLDIPIFGYGLMLVIGFLAAAQLAKFLARRSGLDPEVFINAGLLALVSGVIGARLSHVLENLGQYTDPSDRKSTR